MKTFTIQLDFDGTLCEHKFPRIGRALIGAVSWVKAWQNAGATIILWTRRSNKICPAYAGYPYTLKDALDWCASNGIDIPETHANTFPESNWTDSPKPPADIIIDDIAYGIPKYEDGSLNWSIIGPEVLLQIEKALK